MTAKEPETGISCQNCGEWVTYKTFKHGHWKCSETGQPQCGYHETSVWTKQVQVE